MKTPVDYIFSYDTKHFFNSWGEPVKLRVDCTIDVLESKNYAGVKCVALDKVHVHEITDMDHDKDVTYLKDQAQIYKEICDRIDKAESYILEKVS